MESDPPVNDIESREPKEIDLRIADTFATTNAANIQFGLYISGCGVAAALVIMGFLIYAIVS
jgi:hypothetical protein